MDGNTFYFEIEQQIMIWLQSVFGDAGLYIGTFFSQFGELVVMISIIGFIYWCYDKDMGKQLGVAIVTAVCLNPLVKNIALRTRPYMDNSGIKCLRAPTDANEDVLNIAAQGYSFPSGHSTNAGAVYGGLAVGLKKKTVTILALIAIFLTGISRVIGGAHYPTDVLVGWILGIAAALIIRWLEEKISSRPVLYGVILLTALPGLFWCRTADYFSGLGLLIGFCAASLVEEKYVRYETGGSLPRKLLRVIGGGLIFFALNKVLKLPFSAEFLEGGTFAALLVRGARYGIIAFVEFALYPMLFNRFGTDSAKTEADISSFRRQSAD